MPTDPQQSLLRGREFAQASLWIRDLGHLAQHRLATMHLRAANIELTSVEPADSPLVGRFARFPACAFAHVRIPRVTGEWARDAASADEVTVVVAASGEIEFQSDPPAIVREPNVAVILPGDTPVPFRTTENANELVYASVDRGIVADLLPPASSAPSGPIRSPEALAPLLAFVQQVCSTGGTDAAASAALHAAARQIVRSLVHIVLSEGEEHRSLFDVATAVIDATHVDPATNTATIARRLQVTPRVLQLEFQRHGTTVTRELRRARVATAKQVRAAAPRLPAPEVARRAGFGSVATMFRALRESEPAPR